MIIVRRVSEKMRIGGSLVVILFLFIFTAILVKVPMEADSFFSVTMGTIWFINCESPNTVCVFYSMNLVLSDTTCLVVW